jgi:hypothetical protein
MAMSSTYSYHTTFCPYATALNIFSTYAKKKERDHSTTLILQDGQTQIR